MTSVQFMKLCASIAIVMLAYCIPYYTYCRVKGYVDSGYHNMPDGLYFIFEVFRIVLSIFFFAVAVYLVFWGLLL